MLFRSTERGERERLARYVGSECLARELDGGEAASLDAHAVADACPGKIQLLTPDGEAQVAAASLAQEHMAHVLHDPGKHLLRPSALSCVARPQSQSQVLADLLHLEQREGRRLRQSRQRWQVDQRPRGGAEQSRTDIQQQLIGK